MSLLLFSGCVVAFCCLFVALLLVVVVVVVVGGGGGVLVVVVCVVVVAVAVAVALLLLLVLLLLLLLVFLGPLFVVADGDDCGGVMVIVLAGLCGYRTVGLARLAYARCLCFFLLGRFFWHWCWCFWDLGGVFECCFWFWSRCCCW